MQLPPDERKPRKRPPRRDAIREAAERAASLEPPVDPAPDTEPADPPRREWWEEATETDEPAPSPGLQRTFGQWLEGLIPPDAQLHFINAGKEFATGLQMTVDHHLHRDRPGRERSGPFRIEID